MLLQHIRIIPILVSSILLGVRFAVAAAAAAAAACDDLNLQKGRGGCIRRGMRVKLAKVFPVGLSPRSAISPCRGAVTAMKSLYYPFAAPYPNPTAPPPSRPHPSIVWKMLR